MNHNLLAFMGAHKLYFTSENTAGKPVFIQTKASDILEIAEKLGMKITIEKTVIYNARSKFMTDALIVTHDPQPAGKEEKVTGDEKRVT